MTQAFPKISTVQYEGPKSKNPLAFKYYNAAEVVEGKTMREHLRFSVVYWHTLRGRGLGHVRRADNGPRRGTTSAIPWTMPANGARVAFEFFEKLGAPFYAFHDRDVAPEGNTLAQTNKNLDAVVKVLARGAAAHRESRLLWGTACLFAHPRYAHGAATSCNAEVFAYAAAQVKKAIEVTHELGGAGYVFWGGREGYSTLLNTDLKRELDHLAKFLHMAVDYKKKIGFKGPVLHRAQTEGADQTSIRFRRGGLPEFSARVRFARPSQIESRDQPRHPRRPHHAARVGSGRRRRRPRLDRRQHRRFAPRLGHRPVSDRHLPDNPMHVDRF